MDEIENNNVFNFKYDAKMQTGGKVGEILIYSEIVSWKWKADDPEITALEFDAALKEVKGADTINIRINSPGGSIYQAIAMRAMMAQVTAKEKNVYIEGLCASAATLLACVPGWKVYIAEGSSYMIHNPYTWVVGDASAMEKEAQRMRDIEGQIRDIYNARCGKDNDVIKAWMNDTKWFTADAAVAEGFVDELTTAAEAVARADVPRDAVMLMKALYGNVPDGIQAAAPQQTTDSNGDVRMPAAAPTEHKETKGDMSMDLKDITQEQLNAENKELLDAIMQQGVQQERRRIEEIDDLTPLGYEEMAAEAKKEGTSAADFLKAVVKAQKEKGAKFLENRSKEKEAANNVAPGAPEDNDDAEDYDALAKEMAAFAKDARTELNENMF